MKTYSIKRLINTSIKNGLIFKDIKEAENFAKKVLEKENYEMIAVVENKKPDDRYKRIEDTTVHLSTLCFDEKIKTPRFF